MKPLEFNVRGIKQLLARGYQKKALAIYFVMSRPYLNRVLSGTAPTPHPGVALYVNARVDHLLSKRGE